MKDDNIIDTNFPYSAKTCKLTAKELLDILLQVPPDTEIQLHSEYYDEDTENFIGLCMVSAYEAYYDGNTVIIKD